MARRLVAPRVAAQRGRHARDDRLHRRHRDQEGRRTLRFSTEIFPKAEEQSVALPEAPPRVGYTAPALETTLARFRTDAEIFREENVPLFAEIEEHSAATRRSPAG